MREGGGEKRVRAVAINLQDYVIVHFVNGGKERERVCVEE